MKIHPNGLEPSKCDMYNFYTCTLAEMNERISESQSCFGDEFQAQQPTLEIKPSMLEHKEECDCASLAIASSKLANIFLL